MKKKIKKYINGFSVIELLVVITVFAVIGVLASRSIFLTLRSSKKSDSLVKVRENVNYSLSIIERQLRNSSTISSTCTGASSSSVSYTTAEGVASSFSCVTPGASGYIASGSARLTSDEISVNACSFICNQPDINNPPTISVSVTAEESVSSSTEKGFITTQTEIVVRNY
jgi:prepilin-type N-terminal cleavage/methylation domain-containing protein